MYAIEITEIPRSYFEHAMKHLEKKASSPTHVKLERFLSSLSHTDVPTGFRIQGLGGNARLLYVTRGTRSNMEAIKESFAAHFPEFVVQSLSEVGCPLVAGQANAALLTGVPQPAVQALQAMTEIMVNFKGNSLYQVWMVPAGPSRVKRILAKKRYRSALEGSQRQKTTQTWLGGQETATQADVNAKMSLKHLERNYERSISNRILKCQVTLAFWDRPDSEEKLRTAVNALLAALSSSHRNARMKVRFLSGKIAQEVIRKTLMLERRRMTTELLPKEAVSLVETPSVEVGTRVGSPASFSTSGSKTTQPTSETLEFQTDHIALGHVFRHNTVDKSRTKLIEMEQLRLHTAIVGMSGSGKSTTKNRIVIDAWRNGIPSLLIEPVKADARILMGAIPEMRIFTVGREDVAPYRHNPFLIDANVPVQLHIDLLYSCFLAAWPLYGILANHLRKVINRTYKHNGWDLLNNRPGKTITLDMFLEEAETYSRNLRYGAELKKDFEGAIVARAQDLCDQSRAAILNAERNLPIDELLSKPTIIELKHIGDPSFKALMLSLLIIRVYEFFDKLGPANKLRNLLVIDEAHSFLEELPRIADMSEGAVSRRQVLDQLLNLIAEARSSGLGLVIADQNPARLSRDALKTCNTKIVHRLTSPEDWDLLGRETGCTPEQARHIGVLKNGEIVLRLPSDDVPTKVKVFHDPEFHPDMKQNWTDDDVRRRMKLFYDTHLDFAITPRAPQLESGTNRDDIVQLALLVEDVVQDDDFRRLYLASIGVKGQDDTAHRVEEVIAFYAASLQVPNLNPIEFAWVLLKRSVEVLGAPSNPPDRDLVAKLVGDNLQSGLTPPESGGV